MLLEPLRAMWRRLRGYLHVRLSWRDDPAWRPPARPSEELEQFAERAAKYREAAVQKIFADLSAIAARSPGPVRMVARITGDNTAAVEAISRCCAPLVCQSTGAAPSGRSDSVEFVAEDSAGAFDIRFCIAGARAPKSRSHTATLRQ